MIKLDTTPTRPGELPRIKGLGAGISPDEVAVVTNGTSQLEAGRSVVLATAGGGKRFELTTRADIPGGTDGEDGTYVAETVSAVIGDDVDNPTLRLYSTADVVGKVRSTAGKLLLVTTLLAVVTASASLWFEFGGETGPTASQTARDTQKLLVWMTQPELSIMPTASPERVAQIRNELDRRQRLGDACLEERRGGSGGLEKLQGITCAAKAPSFLRDKDNAAPTAALLGIIAAVIAAIGAFRQFRPGTSPT